MEIIVFTLILLSVIPLFIAQRRAKNGKKYKALVFSNIGLFFLIGIGIMVYMPLSFSAETAQAATDAAANNSDGIARGLGYLAAALSTGLSCIGAGIAVAGAASSAIGATSENPKMLAKSLIFVALAEGVALYGMLISFQIIGSL